MQIEALNIARFVALLGMLFLALGYLTGFANQPIALNMFLLLNGRAPALLLLVIGIQVGLGNPPFRSLLLQGLVIMAVGIALSALFPPTVLVVLGQSMIVAALVRRYAATHLRWIILVIIVLPYALWQIGYSTGYSWAGDVGGMDRYLLFFGWYILFPWSAFFLIGLWAARFDLSDARLPRRLAILGFLAALALKAVNGMLSSISQEVAWAVALSPNPPNILFILFTLACVTSALGIIMLITPRLGSLAQVLAVPGEMVLSLLVLMALSVIAVAIMGQGWGLSAAILTLQIGASLLLLAHLWRRVMPAGPFEGLLAKIR